MGLEYTGLEELGEGDSICVAMGKPSHMLGDDFLLLLPGVSQVPMRNPFPISVRRPNRLTGSPGDALEGQSFGLSLGPYEEGGQM